MAWTAQEFSPSPQLSMVRLAGPGGPLESPLLVIAKVGGERQLKILAGGSPLLSVDDFDEAYEKAAKDLFFKAAKAMAGQGPEGASQKAASIVKSLLPEI